MTNDVMTRYVARAASIGSIASVVIGCHGQSVQARSNFVEDGVVMDAPAAWIGERIEIDNAGVTVAGGVAISATDTDRVHAVARMLAVADTYDKPSADQAILAATKSYTVTTAATVTMVKCAHGTTFASAAGSDSGCDALDVSVPRGETGKTLSVAARSGNGKVAVSFRGAEVAELNLHASHGIVDVTTPTTKGATITVVAETGDDITMHLPQDFAADAIVLDTSPEKIDTSAFPDLQLGKGRGMAGSGAATITLKSGVAGGLRGYIVLVPQVGN